MKNKIKIIPNRLRSRLVKIDWRWIDLAKAMGAGLRTLHNWNKTGWPHAELDIAMDLIEEKEGEILGMVKISKEKVKKWLVEVDSEN